jgi:pimeloyl-ACP methyl ester carboxylesterase
VATERRSLTRPDGRVIEFLVAGPEDGLPLVLHEGTPCGLVLYSPTLRVAAVRGLRVILAARPGYEGSTPRPGRRVVDVAEDTAAVLDDLGAGSFVTLGWSGGGPHALAWTGASPWAGSRRRRCPLIRHRSPSGRVTRTGWSRSLTGSGWPPPSGAPAFT